jgi:hypothetical protein
MNTIPDGVFGTQKHRLGRLNLCANPILEPRSRPTNHPGNAVVQPEMMLQDVQITGH